MTGDIFKPNTERGIFKTVDGGKTWKKTLYLSDQLGAMDVEFQPGNPSVVYAWMSRLERKPWTIISGGKDGGFYKSTNGGDTFTKISTGLPTGLIGKGNLATTAANPNRVYALVEALPGGGLYRSDDAGQTWAQVNATPGLVQRPFYYTTLGADPTNADVVYAGAETFYKSVDGGKTVTPMRTPHSDNHDIWISPNDGQVMIQANDGGANVSTDGGRTWSTQMNQVTGEFYAVLAGQRVPLQDLRRPAGRQHGDPVERGEPVQPGRLAGRPRLRDRSDHPAPDRPEHDLRLVQGPVRGDGPAHRAEQELLDRRAVALRQRGQRADPPLPARVADEHVSPFDPNVLYYGSQYLHRTRDKGVTWEKISPDLTAFPPCCQGPSGEPITRDVTGEEFYSTLYAISESPLEKGVIWTGSNDGPFSVTRDNGLTWSRVTPKDLPEGGRVAFIDPSPHRRGSAYYAVYRYLLGDYAPYIYKTDDYGKTWKRLTDGKNGIPIDTPTRVVREDPNREGLLYAGTEFGMYISFDDGAHWQPFFQNMPQIPINDIKVHKKDLLVATQGRAFWIMDNLSVLHQLTPAVAEGRGDAVRAARRVSHAREPGDARADVRVLPAVGARRAGADRGARRAGRGREQLQQRRARRRAACAADAGGRGGAGGAGGGRRSDGPRGAVVRPRRSGGADARDEGRRRQPRRVEPAEPRRRHDAARVVPGEADGERRQPDEAVQGADRSERRGDGRHRRRPRRAAPARAERAGVHAAGEPAGDARADGARRPRRTDRRRSSPRSRRSTRSWSTWPEGVRYSRPGLQAHTSYLAGLGTRVDQKVGRDAFERLAVLKKDYARLKAEADKVIGQ